MSLGTFKSSSIGLLCGTIRRDKIKFIFLLASKRSDKLILKAEQLLVLLFERLLGLDVCKGSRLRVVDVS